MTCPELLSCSVTVSDPTGSSPNCKMLKRSQAIYGRKYSATSSSCCVSHGPQRGQWPEVLRNGLGFVPSPWPVPISPFSIEIHKEAWSVSLRRGFEAQPLFSTVRLSSTEGTDSLKVAECGLADPEPGHPRPLLSQRLWPSVIHLFIFKVFSLVARSWDWLRPTCVCFRNKLTTNQVV